jgi:hypothetical protein
MLRNRSGSEEGEMIDNRFLNVTASATAQPINATIKFRDGRTVDVRLNERTSTGGHYEFEDIESITYYTIEGLDASIDVGTTSE